MGVCCSVKGRVFGRDSRKGSKSETKACFELVVSRVNHTSPSTQFWKRERRMPGGILRLGHLRWRRIRDFWRIAFPIFLR